jgi:hypothetical protein
MYRSYKATQYSISGIPMTNYELPGLVQKFIDLCGSNIPSELREIQTDVRISAQE